MKKKEIALQKAYVKGKKSTNNSNNAIATNNNDPNELKNAHAKIKEKRKLREVNFWKIMDLIFKIFSKRNSGKWRT